MFREYKCGCITSEMCGRVRVCSKHALSFESRDGMGGASQLGTLRGRTKYYPAFGEAVHGWTGK